MKNLLLSLFFLVTGSMFSQIITLEDHERNEIYGYLIFYKVEKVDKNNELYLAQLLDVNLNKVAQNTFTDGKNINIGSVHFNGDYVYFEVIDNKYVPKEIPVKKFSYRIFDLKQNTISESYTLSEEEKDLHIVESFSLPNKGFGMVNRNHKTNISEFYAIDGNNQLLYKSYPYGNKAKKKEIEHIDVVASKQGVLATISTKYEHKRSKDSKMTVLLTDLYTGDLINEVCFDDEQFHFYPTKVQIINGKIFVFGDSFETKMNLNSNKAAGFFKAELDMKGNVVKLDNRLWSDLQSKITIEEGGFVKKKGYIYTHDHVYDIETQHTIVVGEYIKGSLSSISVEDIVFLEFDENFNLLQVFNEPTKKSVLNFNGIKMGGSRDFAGLLKSYGYFDYRFSNQLEKDGGLVFFYFSLEKAGFFKSEFSHGMVVFKDGKFSSSKLKWDFSVWKKEGMVLRPAKPGYFLLSKINKDEILENRLERIEY